MSTFVRLGGSGGSVPGSKVGALTLPMSTEEALEAGVLAVPLERADIDEIVDIVEEIDSFEALRIKCSDGLRGGKAGEGLVDCLL